MRGKKKPGRQAQDFATYIAKAEGMEFKIVAPNAKTAEYIARNLLGAELIYREPKGPEDIQKVVDALMDPGGIYNGELSLIKVEP